jgi:hypothetical protein
MNRPECSPLASTEIPDADTLARYLKPRQIIRDPETDAPIGVFPDAFRLRDDEEYLSAAWLEHYAGQTAAVQLSATKQAFQAAMNTPKKSAIALGKVEDIRAACASFSMRVRVLHEPDEPHLPCHAAVRRYRDDQEALLQMLADSAWAGVSPLY